MSIHKTDSSDVHMIFVLFVLQGVDLEKLMEASIFICRYLNRRPASKVVQALHSNKL